MIQKLQPTGNDLGRDLSAKIPVASQLAGLPRLSEFEQRIWAQAAHLLVTRRNDNHTLFAYGIARALLESYPEANPDVVRPAILLHDIGWSQVPDRQVLEAIAPGGGRKDLVAVHEEAGAHLAREILTGLDYPAQLIDEIVEIIAGHDSRLEALSINDAIVKDADKIWRVTPAGLDIIMDWFGLTREQALRLSTSRVHGYLFTDYGKAMAMACTSLESMATTDEVKATLR